MKHTAPSPNNSDAAVNRTFAGIPALLDHAPALIARGRAPDDTMRAAAAIKGAGVTIMEQPGHFPMSENPEQFPRYIVPVPSEILKQSTPSKQGVHV